MTVLGSGWRVWSMPAGKCPVFPALNSGGFSQNTRIQINTNSRTNSTMTERSCWEKLSPHTQPSQCHSIMKAGGFFPKTKNHLEKGTPSKWTSQRVLLPRQQYSKQFEIGLFDVQLRGSSSFFPGCRWKFPGKTGLFAGVRWHCAIFFVWTGFSVVNF